MGPAALRRARTATCSRRSATGTASVVTDHIDTFTETGLLLESGAELEADIIVTATGLELLFIGGIEAVGRRRGRRPAEQAHLQGHDARGRAEPRPGRRLHERLVDAEVRPHVRLRRPACSTTCTTTGPAAVHAGQPRRRRSPPQPLLGLSSGYVQRSADRFPKQGSKFPWQVHQSYLRDYRALKLSGIDDEAMVFSNPVDGQVKRSPSPSWPPHPDPGSAHSAGPPERPCIHYMAVLESGRGDATVQGSQARTRRRYESPRRLQQRRRRRAAVLEAATELFGENGWAGTGMRDVARARRRGGGDRVLELRVEDGAAARGGSMWPWSATSSRSRSADGRSSRSSVGGPWRRGRVRRPRLVRQIHERTYGIGRALREAAAGDAESGEAVGGGRGAAPHQRRPRRASSSPDGRSATPSADGLWAVMGMEVYQLLVDRAGWSAARYEEWLADDDRPSVAGAPGRRGHDPYPERAGRHADDGHRPRRAAARPRPRHRRALDGALSRARPAASRSASTSAG